MSLFVISRSNMTRPAALLDAVVISLDEDKPAVAFFTHRRQAESYVEATAGEHPQCVLELAPSQLGEWLFEAIRSGIRHVAINPAHRQYPTTHKPFTIDLQRQLGYGGLLLAAELQEASNQHNSSGFIPHLYQCEECGRIAAEAG